MLRSIASLALGWLWSSLLLLQATAVAAQPVGSEGAGPAAQVSRPLASQRLVALFEFDQLEPYDLPRYWDLDTGSGHAGDRRFPAWNSAALDQSVACRGEGSVRLTTNGGSVRLRLDPGVVPVFPETEYLVSARVQTRGLRHARAAIAARYLDGQARPIPGSDRRSELILTEDAREDPRAGANWQPHSRSRGEELWAPAVVALDGSVADAAYIQIDLEILQAEQHEMTEAGGGALLGPHQVWPQDFSGHAWFDDVAVVQLPRVRMATSSPINIIEHPEQPQISILVRDLAGQPLMATLLVQDAAGAIVATRVQEIRGGAELLTWRPELKRFGWYRAILELASGAAGDGSSAQRIGAAHLDFAWVPAREDRGGQMHDRASFALMIRTLPPSQIGHLAGLVHQSGAGAVVVPVWHAQLSPEQLPALAQSLAQSLASLKMSALQVAFSLPVLPRQLAAAAHLDSARVPAVFGADETIWAPFLMPLLDRFGQSVQRWHLGQAVLPAHAADLERLREVLARLVPGPSVVLPWNGDVAPAHCGADGLTVTVPGSIPPAALRDFISAWSEPGEAMFAIEPLPVEQYSRHHIAADLVKRGVMLWWARSSVPGHAELCMALPQPWTWSSEASAWPASGAAWSDSPGDVRGGSRLHPVPTVELAAWRTLVERLSGRRIVGAFPAGQGIFCLILAPVEGTGGRGALVAWRSAALESPVVQAYLGAGPVTVFDIFGNSAPVPLGPGPVHRIAMTDAPVFIEGVDTGLASFIASLAVEPRVLEPRLGEHNIFILLSNPWPVHAQGRIRILEPGGLSEDPLGADRVQGVGRVTPRVLDFAMAPGQSVRLPVRIAFSAVEEHGVRDLVAEVELHGMRVPTLRLSAPMEIRLDELELDLSYHVVGGEAGDIVLETILTNRSGAAATLEVTAFAAGYPRARASIAELAAGTTATRRFGFPRGAQSLRKREIVVMVHNPQTGARITRTVIVE
jgi:hypothetical protein